jgi:hypothetical protein
VYFAVGLDAGAQALAVGDTIDREDDAAAQIAFLDQPGGQAGIARIERRDQVAHFLTWNGHVWGAAGQVAQEGWNPDSCHSESKFRRRL